MVSVFETVDGKISFFKNYVSMTSLKLTIQVHLMAEKDGGARCMVQKGRLSLFFNHGCILDFHLPFPLKLGAVAPLQIAAIMFFASGRILSHYLHDSKPTEISQRIHRNQQIQQFLPLLALNFFYAFSSLVVFHGPGKKTDIWKEKMMTHHFLLFTKYRQHVT